MERNFSFAAFIITYQRSEILSNTINIILGQTFPPEELLIVDNSEDFKTKDLVEKIRSDKIIYKRVGYNSGPAGGSRLGLEFFTQKGYDWIYWGDDNNPPRDITVFERMFECISKLEKNDIQPGIIAGKGAYFNKVTGRIRSLSNKELKKSDITEVDVVPGGHTLIVNSAIIRANITPNEKLFFAFEDLDFSLKAKKAGFKIFVDSLTWLNVRYNHNDLSATYRPRNSAFRNGDENWNREYYSARNLLFIFYKNGLFLPFVIQFGKILLKIFYGILRGLKGGNKISKTYMKAIIDFLRGNYQNILKVN